MLKYDYLDIMEYGPHGIHRWRQSDSAIQVSCYYNNGMRFFQPCVYNLHNGTGAAVSEFPILYYCTALLYPIFGPDHSILRWLNFLILVGGLYCFSRMLLKILDDVALSVIIPMLLLGASVIAYYGFTYIPNTPALGLTLMSIYFYYEYHRQQKRVYFWWAVALMLLAALIKVTLLVVFLSWLGAYVLTRLPFFTKKRADDFFPSLPMVAAATSIILGGALGWVIWAKHYNELHQSGLFLAAVRPIWEMTEKNLSYTWYLLGTRTENYFYAYPICWIFVGMLAFILFHLKRIRPEVSLMFGLLILGSIAYLLLFFDQLRVHNYYFVDVMLVPLVLLAIFAAVVQSYLNKNWQRGLFTVLVFILVNVNVNSAYFYNFKAYEPTQLEIKDVNSSLYKTAELQQFLVEQGIDQAAKIVSIPDGTPNNTLYYLDRKGWTETFHGKNLISQLPNFQRLGARFLIISDREYGPVKTFMDTVQVVPKVFDESVYIFDIEELVKN